jgi:hypothetical protein
MRPSEYLTKKAIAPRAEKFSTQAQITERLATLHAMQFAKGQRGIGSRDLEVKLLTQRLHEMQCPALPL